MRAIGYHGTSVSNAERILAQGFQVSRNDNDWLGDGAYFFQDSPAQAAEWARQRFGGDAAVLGAEIDLDGCLDLLDPRWHDAVRKSFSRLIRRIQNAGAEIPRQTVGAHRLDREVVNRAAEMLEAAGIPVQSVRAAFVEGEPLFPGSALWSQAHIQIAVRNPDVIVRLWRAD